MLRAWLAAAAVMMPGAADRAPPSAPIRAMIADARRVIAAEGEQLWPGFARAPVAIDLIEADRETLFCRSALTGFVSAGRDKVTGCAMLTRRRVLASDLAGSSDLAGGVQAIAIGTPKTIEMSSAAWRTTLLHEAFHQYQAALPGYAAAVADVRRAIGGGGGSWALDYRFPYADPALRMPFVRMTAAARMFLAATSTTAARDAVRRYVEARRAAQAAVSVADWRYYEFQVGQEGVARWSEITLAERAGRRDPALAAESRERRAGLSTSLRAIDEQGVGVWKRAALYVFGAIEAEMLDRTRPGWRTVYRAQPFALGRQLEAAVRAPPPIS